MMKKLYRNIFFCLIIFTFLFGILLPSHVSAQTITGDLDISVNPPIFDLHAQPGDTIQNKFRIRNNANEATSLTISAKKLISSPLSGQPVPADPGPADSYMSWIHFDSSTFTVAAKEWKTVNFTLAIPKDAAFG